MTLQNDQKETMEIIRNKTNPVLTDYSEKTKYIKITTLGTTKGVKY